MMGLFCFRWRLILWDLCPHRIWISGIMASENVPIRPLAACNQVMVTRPSRALIEGGAGVRILMKAVFGEQ